MSKLSKNGSGVLILALSIIGVEVSESSAIEFISSVGTLVSFALMIWNQVDRKDVEGFIFKK